MAFKRGDHVCGLYSTTEELVQFVATFIADGLRRGERCWYVAHGHETDALQERLEILNIDAKVETARGALKIVSGDGAYVIQGGFNPEATLAIFNEAIEQAYTDGFTAFRAAAEMSWVLDCDDGAYQLILYEALLRSLFESCRATGLCLYNRTRMPLAVINGALATHPIAGSHGRCAANPFYDLHTHRMPVVNEAEVVQKLELLDQSK
jgi:hypothetical protein